MPALPRLTTKHLQKFALLYKAPPSLPCHAAPRHALTGTNTQRTSATAPALPSHAMRNSPSYTRTNCAAQHIACLALPLLAEQRTTSPYRDPLSLPCLCLALPNLARPQSAEFSLTMPALPGRAIQERALPDPAEMRRTIPCQILFKRLVVVCRRRPFVFSLDASSFSRSMRVPC